MHIYKLILVFITTCLSVAVAKDFDNQNNTLTNLNIIAKDSYIKFGLNQQIHVREKKLNNKDIKPVIVLLNPLSIPSLEAFDVPHFSLMDKLARLGYDVWSLDFIGEGVSSYPQVMQQNPAPRGGKYPLRATDALVQLQTLVDYINKVGGDTSSISLLGWSWGSIIATMYAINNPHKVDKLILYGAMYSSVIARPLEMVFLWPYEATPNVFGNNLPNYQIVTWGVVNSHWDMMLPYNDRNIRSEDALNQVAMTYAKIDPHSFVKGAIRRPMGPMQDLFSIWNGKPIYDISKLITPTLVIYGQQDMFADRQLFSQLHNVKNKREVKISQATHWVIYERGCDEFIAAVNSFLRN